MNKFKIIELIKEYRSYQIKNSPPYLVLTKILDDINEDEYKKEDKNSWTDRVLGEKEEKDRKAVKNFKEAG